MFQEATTVAPGVSVASLQLSEAKAVTPSINGCEELKLPSDRLLKTLVTGMV